MTTTATQIDLMPFCDTDGQISRYVLWNPWREAGYIYATDGRRIARVPDDGRELEAVEGTRPAATQLFHVMKFPERGWTPLPELKSTADDNFVLGESKVSCKRCENGKRECDMGHVHICDKCYGEGFIWAANEFDESTIRPFWAVATECAIQRTKAGPTIYFRAERGFEGIAMGLSND